MAVRIQACALRCTPERFVRIGAGLLAHAESVRPERSEAESKAEPALATLVVAELQNEAIALGRFQRLESALDKSACGSGLQSATDVIRRSSGGRALLIAPGTLGVLFAAPDPTALVGAPVPPDKVMNRFVRGLLAGLTRLGVPGGAHYFGRDFISAQSRKLAVVGQDGTARAALFEAFVAMEEPLGLPGGTSGYPAHADPRASGPEWHSFVATVSRARPDLDALASAIFEGYASQHRTDLTRIDPAELPEAPLEPAAEDEAGFTDSGVAEIPIGFLEALVRAESGTVVEARLRGDFIAPAFAIRALERSLAGAPLEFRELGQRVDAAFHQPGAGIVGVRELRIFAEAILAAAQG